MVPFTLLKAFGTFFRIGFFTIGGGPVMIPFIEQEVVEKKGWLTKEEFMDLMVVSQSLPGVFAANFAIAIGYRLGKVRGGIACAAGTVLPSIICILAIALFFRQCSAASVRLSPPSSSDPSSVCRGQRGLHGVTPGYLLYVRCSFGSWVSHPFGSSWQVFSAG